MKQMKKDIKPSQMITTFFALESMEIKKSKAQQNFLALDLYDRTGRIKGYLWNEPVVVAATLTEKSFVKVRGIAKMINNSLIIEIEKIRKAEKHEIDMRDFLEVVSGGIDLWYKKLLDLVKLVRDVNCKRLIDSFLADEGFIELFTTSPGGVSVHHNYVGGLLEHTVNTMELAALTADRNSGLLDKDLLLTGSFLHDIGKIREIYWEIAKEYTTEGKLLGHIGIGLLMLEDKLSRIKDFPEDLSMLLKHMILSHHGELEYGSPVKPATPEALALHLIENTDAKINHLYCHLGNSNPDRQWSHFDRFLNTEIYQKKFSKHIPKEIRVEAA
jgi:3'-5' exoribonuclease